MNSGFVRTLVLSFILMLGIAVHSYATHLRAGEIIVERVSCNSLTFRITVTVFTNTINTNVLFGGEDDWLEFGDGTRMLVPETTNTPRPDLGEGIATASFTVLHTYSGFQNYIVSYSEPNRNEGVANMDGSVNTRFYIETKIIIDPFLGCNNTPKLLVPPIDRACTGVAWFHNPGAYDPDGDSLSYELVVPFREKETQVVNYKDPSDAKFSTSDETGSGPPTFSINPTDGTITWDAPGTVGEYNIAFHIKEWRNVAGKWISTGYVRRDMQIIVDDCDNERPDLIVPEDVCVEAGSILDATILGIDPDGDDVKIEAFSEIFNFPTAQSPATYTPNPPDFQPTNPEAELNFQWQTDCAHVKEQPYQVVFKVTDRSPTGSRLVTFKTWFIKVVGPEPKWVDVQVDLPTRSANLQWESYFCQNAETIEVWRRVDSFAFEPDSCQTGMPDFLGYNRIATLPVKDANNTPTTTFSDTNGGSGLASGAKYCYRLVAIFPLPRGGESYVSDEFCIDPILADKPIITHVSINGTGTTDGQITVSWVAPFEADPLQFPPPYTYDVWRAEGFAGDVNLTKVTSTNLLTITDTGLNTEEKIYNYRIIGFDANNSPLDTSAIASSVRVEAQSQLNKIQLTWSAFVPWSNLRLQTPNRHVIYRGEEGTPHEELDSIAAVDVTVNGFTFIDEGPLENNKVYCYRIETYGGYGNPQINEPLINSSQKICALPGDETPPCIPELSVNLVNCEDMDINTLCNVNIYKNTLYWPRPESECGIDISGYRIYRSKRLNGEYTLQNSDVLVRDTFFIDDDLDSYAYCYKISAVDRSNNESELSEAVCSDNCPYYELPNIFTPNRDDCNDLFSAFSDNDRYITTGENEQQVIQCGGVTDESRCARFVERVVFRVYNRWGKEVYSYTGARNDERTIYIDWDGRANDGSDLAAGIYYYAADVTFDSVDPEKQNKVIKGWVHLIR
jgi:hypothetical protein